jgi:hypothetical protein
MNKFIDDLDPHGLELDDLNSHDLLDIRKCCFSSSVFRHLDLLD